MANVLEPYQEACINGGDGLCAPNEAPILDGANAQQIDDFLGPNPEYNEEEEERKYYRRKRFIVIKNVLAASIGGTLTYGVYLGLLQMQLILHYDETYREVKYGSVGLQNIDHSMLVGINVTPIAALFYTPVLIRFFGTKWVIFLATGIYALFVSTNYWERYYTLVPSAVGIGVIIVPLWASMGNYITRMAQKYYEYANYREEHVQEQRKAPRGACHPYIIVFQTVFYSFFFLSFILAEFPTTFFLQKFLQHMNHTLCNVKHCGSSSVGILPDFNKTVLLSLPRSNDLILVESVLMIVAFLSMVLVLALCGAAYRPTEEIDLRSIGWGSIFQQPFKHMRDYRLRHLFPFFIYSGFEVLFIFTGFTLCYGVCTIGMENLAYIIIAFGLSGAVFSWLSLIMLKVHRKVLLLAGAAIHCILLIVLFIWDPKPRDLNQTPFVYLFAIVWAMGSALNKTCLSITLGMFYEDKERQDFVFTIYHWWQAIAIFIVYLWASLPMKAKLAIMLATVLISIVSYLWMERKLALNVHFRIPKIPKPKHRVRGYRYMEEENSDESGSERSEEGRDSEEEDGVDEEEEEEEEGQERRGAGHLGGRGEKRRQPRRRQHHNNHCYEQAVEEEE